MISCLMTVNNIIVYCCITAEKLKHCEFLLTGGPANPAGPGAPISPRSPQQDEEKILINTKTNFTLHKTTNFLMYFIQLSSCKVTTLHYCFTFTLNKRQTNVCLQGHHEHQEHQLNQWDQFHPVGKEKDKKIKQSAQIISTTTINHWQKTTGKTRHVPLRHQDQKDQVGQLDQSNPDKKMTDRSLLLISYKKQAIS